MSTPTIETPPSEDLVKALCQADAYPHPGDGSVVLHETHISWVFLVGEFAYKVKKPIKTNFLDYGTLEKRHRYCEEELRLDRRYSKDLYLEVVPISIEFGNVRVEGAGAPIEYAVKMRRFPEGSLLSERLEAGTLTTDEVRQLAIKVAGFHHDACRLQRNQPWGSPDSVYRNALDNLSDLQAGVDGPASATIRTLDSWTRTYFAEHLIDFRQRVANGFIRECHGDLHLQNVIDWRGQLTPFDGIEFNDEYRWIDVMSDAAFLAMDFAALGRLDLCRSFMNAYLEQTGDHASVALLRWYLTYRALVRAKVASLRADQTGIGAVDRLAAQTGCTNHINLAYRFTLRESPQLWITHGVSGSGKTTLGELVVQRHDAIRLRSDIERKRHFGLSITDRPDERMKQELYSDAASRATYGRLRQLAHSILQSGYSVLVDATFLKRHERELFHEFANEEGVSFAILDCHADQQTLRQRVADRMARDDDASDADLDVLDMQLRTHEPLTESEKQFVVDVPDPVAIVESL